jgi:hypothetical protein
MSLLTTMDVQKSVTYKSKKSSLDDVRKSLYRRLMWSDDRYNTINGAVGKLTTCCDEIMERVFKGLDSQATLGIAWRGKCLYLASQGFNINMSEKVDELRNYISEEFAMDDIESVHQVTTTALGLGNLTGIHAEMMIVRFINRVQGIPKNQISAEGMTVGTTTDKGCCPNCSGFMNIYNIPHTGVRPKLSGMWRHPISLNKYMHNANDPFGENANVNLRYESYAGNYEFNAKGKLLGTGSPPTNGVEKTKDIPDDNATLKENLGLDPD